MRRLLLLLVSGGLYVYSQTVCQSEVMLYNDVCPAEQTQLNCDYIQANFDAICGFMDANTVANGESCSLHSNCTYNAFQASTNNVLCCTTAATSSPAPSESVSSLASSSPFRSSSLVRSATATVTCPYRQYNSGADFSSSQGNQGWYYGYYNGAGAFTQFSHYGVSSSGSVGAVNSWNYASSSNGIISSSMMMPNGGASCNTASFGNIVPVLRWYNPVGSCYSDVTVTLYINRPSSFGSGITVSLTMNGVTVYSGSLVATTTFTNYYNGYGVNSVELAVSGNNNDCDYAQLTYGLTIVPMGESGTVARSASARFSVSNTVTSSVTRTLSSSARASRSVSISGSGSGSPSYSSSPKPSFSQTVTKTADRSLSSSARFSRSVSVSGSGSGSRSVTNSPRSTNSRTISATATSTVFYTGNWTDMAHIYYQGGDLAQLNDLTLNRCKIACLLNSLCAIISVQTPCDDIVEDSPEADTLTCGICFLKTASGWTSTSNYAHIRTFIYYDEVYPPTRSSIATKTSSASTLPSVSGRTSLSISASPLPSVSGRPSLSISASPMPTTTLKTIFNYNMCGDLGDVYLPITESYADIVTNTATNYGNNWACSMLVKGQNPGTMLTVTFTGFNTEGGYDFLRFYNSVGTLLYTYSGSVLPPTLYIFDDIRITFVSDGSNIGPGAKFRVSLEIPSSSPSVSSSNSPRVSVSALRTITYLDTYTPSAWGSLHSTNTANGTVSSRATHTPSATNTTRAFGQTVTNSYSPSTSSVESGSPSSTGSSSASPSAIVSTSASISTSASPSASISTSASVSTSASPSASASAVLSESSLASVSSWPSSNPSGSGSTSVTASFIYTYSLIVSNTVSLSPARSPSLKPTYSPSFSKSYSQSLTATPYYTRASTPSQTLSRTATASYFMRPKLMTAPVLPANLDLLSSDELSSAITDLGNYDPALVKDNLQLLGAAALFKMDGPLVISTDTFALTMSKLDNTSASPISTEGLDAVMPVIPVAGAAATSVIKWAANPYPNTTVLDSPVISMSVLSKSGSSLGVSNLSVPIVLNWNLNINTNDPRVQDPPSYMALCATGTIFSSTGGPLEKMSISAAGRKSWKVPCLMGTSAWVNCSAEDTVKNFACPTAKMVPRCMYWSNKLGAWAEDGCKAVSGNASGIVCECTHLTDFSARLDSVVAENEAVFNNAKNVYSLEGLLKYAQWYGIFGGIGLVTLILGFFVTRVDYISIQKYVKAICLNKDVAAVLHSTPNTPIFAYDALSTIRETDKKLKHKYHPPHLNLINRILIQHSRLQFLFRFDPRLSRLFRLLSILLLQFHSLFVTALFYGFTYGAGGKSDMMWYDIILLAGLTTALNLPVVKILMTSMNSVGLEEFKAQFPILYAEYERRLAFEKLALAYLLKKRGLKLEDSDDSSENIIALAEKTEQANTGGDDAEDQLLDMVLLYLCCRSKPKSEEEDISELTLHQLMRKMATLIKESYPYIEAYPSSWGVMPFHTRGGFLYTFMSMGWIAWCLNYLLLFAAAHTNDVGENIMKSYATSEITTVFLTQPMIIGASYIFYKLLNTYGKHLPPWLYDKLVVKSVKSIPSLYYFSDPFGKNAKTSFSSEFSYNLFVRCPAASMGATEESYAPQKAIASGEDPTEKTIVIEIKKLYMNFIGAWQEIMHR